MIKDRRMYGAPSNELRMWFGRDLSECARLQKQPLKELRNNEDLLEKILAYAKKKVACGIR